MPFDWEKIVNLGGLALFAFVCLRAVVEISRLRAEDLKESLAREKDARTTLEELHRSTLAAMLGMTAALTDLRSTLTTKLDDTWSGPRRRSSDKAP